MILVCSLNDLRTTESTIEPTFPCSKEPNRSCILPNLSEQMRNKRHPAEVHSTNMCWAPAVYQAWCSMGSELNQSHQDLLTFDPVFF